MFLEVPIVNVAFPTLGGVLTHTLGWPWIPLSNVPSGVAALVASPRLPPVDPSRTPGDVPRPRPDPAGALAGTGCLPAVMLAASGPPVRGWDTLPLTATAVAAGLAAGFADHHGAASGLLNAGQQVGAALGPTGVLPAAAAWIDSHADVVGGRKVGFTIAAGIALLGIVRALVLFTRREADPATSSQPQEVSLR